MDYEVGKSARGAWGLWLYPSLLKPLESGLKPLESGELWEPPPQRSLAGRARAYLVDRSLRRRAGLQSRWTCTSACATIRHPDDDPVPASPDPPASAWTASPRSHCRRQVPSGVIVAPMWPLSARATPVSRRRSTWPSAAPTWLCWTRGAWLGRLGAQWRRSFRGSRTTRTSSSGSSVQSKAGACRRSPGAPPTSSSSLSPATRSLPGAAVRLDQRRAERVRHRNAARGWIEWQRRDAPVELLDRQRVAELTGTTCYGAGCSTGRPARSSRWPMRAGSRGRRSKRGPRFMDAQR